MSASAPALIRLAVEHALKAYRFGKVAAQVSGEGVWEEDRAKFEQDCGRLLDEAIAYSPSEEEMKRYLNGIADCAKTSKAEAPRIRTF